MALFQMNPSGAPGSDGFPTLFYQNNWSTVGKEVTQFVPTVLITQIPKIKKAERVGAFRLICLCNVIYKIVVKVLANRLKPILPEIISINQSAFVPGRLNSDNSLIAYEILHSMSSRFKGNGRYMALKLDMRKAYDRIELSFLEAVINKLGFYS